MNPQKIGGLIVILLGVPLGIIALDRDLAAVATCIGLQMLFFAKERIDDERVHLLKMKAMFIAMSTGIGLTLIAYQTAFMVLRGLAAQRPTISAWEMLGGILLIALGLFHWWRWQDGRAGRTG